MQILEIPAQRKFVSAGCHAHSNAHKPPKTVAPKFLTLKQKCEMYYSNQYLSIDQKNSVPRPQTSHKLQKIVSMNADTSETIKDRELGFVT